MAKLKYEFENHYYQTRRRPLRDYLFGYFHIVAQYTSMAAPVTNTIMGNTLFKKITSMILAITPQRPFPVFSRQIATVDSKAQGERIFFLSDSFSHYVEPQVEQSAFDILAACGYDVRVLPVIGARAALLSKGLLPAAQRHAGKMLDALNQADPTCETAIIGIEPPEIYALKHDYADLLPARKDEIAARAAHTWLLDEFLLRSEKFALLRDRISGPNNSAEKNKQKIKFQPHCHQRAEGPAQDGMPSGSNATVELLQLHGYDVELIDAGCCGMAGTFGYETEHYELSMKVGELKLFPQIREWRKSGSEVEIVSTGAACRMQIQQGAKVKASHSIELIANILKQEGARVKE